jgi:hypothetical protein
MAMMMRTGVLMFRWKNWLGGVRDGVVKPIVLGFGLVLILVNAYVLTTSTSLKISWPIGYFDQWRDEILLRWFEARDGEARRSGMNCFSTTPHVRHEHACQPAMMMKFCRLNPQTHKSGERVLQRRGSNRYLIYYGDYGLNRATLKVSPKQTAVAVKKGRLSTVNSHQVISLIIPYYTLPSRCSSKAVITYWRSIDSSLSGARKRGKETT